MAYFHSPRIVTDGLVLLLDAANTKSYPGSGTTWFDKSGNNRNATFIDNPTISNNTFNLDGVSDGAEIPSFPGIWDGSVTMEGWFFFNESNTRDVLCGTFDSTLDINFERHTSDRLRIYWNADDNYSSDNAAPANTWLHIILIRNKENSKLLYYVNGSLNTETSKSVIDYTTVETLRIGRDTRSADTTNMNGKIGLIKIYNRSLSAAEVLQNYNATKGRFGL
jgi:hypothetical protein